MLAEIGIMIGFYVLTRMLTIERKKDGAPSSLARVFATITFIVATIVILDLLVRGLTATTF